MPSEVVPADDDPPPPTDPAPLHGNSVASGSSHDLIHSTSKTESGRDLDISATREKYSRPGLVKQPSRRKPGGSRHSSEDTTGLGGGWEVG